MNKKILKRIKEMMKTRSIIGMKEIDKLGAPEKRRPHILAYNFVKSPLRKN